MISNGVLKKKVLKQILCFDTNKCNTKLSTIVLLKSGKTPKNEELSSDGIVPYYKVSDMNVPGNETYMKVDSQYLLKDNYRLFPSNSIIFPKNGGALLTNKKRILTKESLVDLNTGVLIPNENVYYKYLFYLVSYLDFNNYYKGTALPTLNSESFLDTLVYVPEIEEQHRIATMIDELFELIDKKEKNDQEKEKLKGYLKEKILDSAIHGKLINNDNKLTKPNITKIECDIPYGIPLNWIWTKIGEVGKVVGGGTPKTNIESYWGGKISWITPADMKSDDKYISNGRKNITETGLSESSAILMPSGTIVISSRAPIGYVKIARNEVSTSQGCKSIIPNDKIVKSDYVFYYIKAIREYLNSIGTGTTFREISGKNLSDVLIPVPPLEEQQRIVEKIEQCFELIEQL